MSVHKGVSARSIKDGPTNFDQQGRIIEVVPPSPSHIGQWKKVMPNIITAAIPPLVSTSTEEWRLSKRFWQGPPEANSVSVGCSLLHAALRAARTISTCPHAASMSGTAQRSCDEVEKHAKFLVTSGVALTSAFRFTGQHKGFRTMIAETYGNSAARWLAILGWYRSDTSRYSFVRHPAVCVGCFVREACQFDDEGSGLYLIL